MVSTTQTTSHMRKMLAVPVLRILANDRTFFRVTHMKPNMAQQTPDTPIAELPNTANSTAEPTSAELAKKASQRHEPMARSSPLPR